LRFQGFEGEWEKRELGEVCDVNPKNISLPNSFTYIDLESVVGGMLLKENIIFKDDAPSRAQRLLEREDILFQMVRPYQKNNFYFDKEGDYVASTGYAQIRSKQNTKFIYQYLHNQKFVDCVIKRCTGTSYPAINSNDLARIQVGIPNLFEQSKIASFLYQLDQRIQTQNKIIEELKVQKVGLCIKLLSRQLRFPEFEERWKESKIGDVVEIGSGKDYKHLARGDVPVFGTGGFMTSIDSYLYDGETVCIGRKGTIDKPFYHKGKIWTVDTLFFTHSYKNILPRFLFYIFEQIVFKLER
jgi:type I restriction enzyme, S subunit